MTHTRHYESHLYSYAVALTQGDRIAPDNLKKLRAKAARHHFTEGDLQAVEADPELYIQTGLYNGPLCYAMDVEKRPNYHDGTPRRKWGELDEVQRQSWRGAFVRINERGQRA